jgi:hypothetical protein
MQRDPPTVFLLNLLKIDIMISPFLYYLPSYFFSYSLAQLYIEVNPRQVFWKIRCLTDIGYSEKKIPDITKNLFYVLI